MPYFCCREIITGEIFMRYERREIAFQQYLADILEALPGEHNLSEEELRMRWLNRQMDELPLVGLLPELRKAAQIWVLSNTTSAHIQHLKTRFEFLREVSGCISSEEAGAAKPSEQIFQYALDIAGTTAEQSIFIDDTGRNAAAAGRLGFYSQHYLDFEETVEFLRLHLKISLGERL